MLNNIGLPGLLLIAAVTLLLFGRGKISGLMGELGQGLTAFKKGLRDSAADLAEGAAPPDAPPATPARPASARPASAGRPKA